MVKAQRMRVVRGTEELELQFVGLWAYQDEVEVVPVDCEGREAQAADAICERRSVHGGGPSSEFCIVELVKFFDGCDGGEYQQILGP